MERAHLETDIRDRFDAQLRTLLIDFHDRALATPAEAERIVELKRVLARMGEVNLTAIDEYEEVSGRYEYLAGQRKDLEDAINQLQEAIDRIDATTKERFVETFEAVNEMFQRLFPRLFNGGQAKLVLTDPDDLLTTGVDILAQPPGKKLQSLELLSGGEKALTAVSLIFGIFLIKRSPFCLLDEVDAPLDEANVGRFSDLVARAGPKHPVHHHHPQQADDGDRRPPVRGDDAAARGLEAGLGQHAPRSQRADCLAPRGVWHFARTRSAASSGECFARHRGGGRREGGGFGVGERSTRPTTQPTEPGPGSLFAVARVTPRGGLRSVSGLVVVWGW